MSDRPARRDPTAAPEPLAPLVGARISDACGARELTAVRSLVERAAAASVTAVVTVRRRPGAAGSPARPNGSARSARRRCSTRADALTDAARAELGRLVAAHPRVAAVEQIDMYWPGRTGVRVRPAGERPVKRTGKPLMI